MERRVVMCQKKKKKNTWKKYIPFVWLSAGVSPENQWAKILFAYYIAYFLMQGKMPDGGL